MQSAMQWIRNSQLRESNLNGATVHRERQTIFIRLPQALWRSAGKCVCPVCKGQEAYWDTLAVSSFPSGSADYAWTVHYPQFRTVQS